MIRMRRYLPGSSGGLCGGSRRLPVLCAMMLLYPATSIFADAVITTGGGVSAATSEQIVAAPVVMAECALDHYSILSDSLTFFLDSLSTVQYTFLRDELEARVYAAGDFSYRRGAFLGRFGVVTDAGGTMWVPDSVAWVTSVELYFSLGDLTLSGYWAPRYVFSYADRAHWIEADTGFSFLMGQEITGDLSLSGGGRWSVDDRGYYLGPAFELTWYPPAPVTFSFEINAARHGSDYRETFFSTEMATQSFWSASVEPEVLFRAGRVFSLELTLPVTFFLKDHQAYDDVGVSDGREFVCALAPEIEFRWSLHRNFSLVLSGESNHRFSNSPGQTGHSVTVTASVEGFFD